MMLFWLWMACGAGSESALEAPALVTEDTKTQQGSDSVWNVESALLPTLQAMDQDQDAEVVRSEYERVMGRGAPFDAVDQDGDGAISVDELAQLMDAQDPQTWEGETRPRKPVAVENWRGLFHGEPKVRQLSELLRFVRAEVRELDIAAALPTDAAIQEAAETGDLESEAVGALLEQMAQIRAGASLPP